MRSIYKFSLFPFRFAPSSTRSIYKLGSSPLFLRRRNFSREAARFWGLCLGRFLFRPGNLSPLTTSVATALFLPSPLWSFPVRSFFTSGLLEVGVLPLPPLPAFFFLISLSRLWHVVLTSVMVGGAIWPPLEFGSFRTLRTWAPLVYTPRASFSRPLCLLASRLPLLGSPIASWPSARRCLLLAFRIPRYSAFHSWVGKHKNKKEIYIYIYIY